MTTIFSKLKSLGELKGKTYGQIVQVLGQPVKTKNVKFDDIGPGTERTWGSFFALITLKFNAKNVCQGVVRRRYPGLYVAAGVLVLVIGLFVADYILTHQPCSLCGEIATHQLYGKWYCEEHYAEMVEYFSALGLS